MTWEWLAGFTDGDGCISKETRQKKGEIYTWARIRWHQKASNGFVLQRIAEFLRDKGIKVSDRAFSVATQGHKYPQMELAVTNAEDTRKVLVALEPHLVLKRKQAQDCVEMLGKVAVAKTQYGWKYRENLKKELFHG